MAATEIPTHYDLSDGEPFGIHNAVPITGGGFRCLVCGAEGSYEEFKFDQKKLRYPYPLPHFEPGAVT